MTDPRPQDDLSIDHAAVLWRRIYPDRSYVHKEADGSYRSSSLAFDDSPDGDPMSMFLAAEAPNVEAVLAGHETFGLASLTAEILRANGQIIVRDRSEIPGHVVVIGEKPHPVRRALVKAANLIRLPEFRT